jgi:CRP-like cAMP-binding protein
MTALRVSHLSDERQKAKAINTALRKTDAFDVSADQLTQICDRPLSVTGAYQIAGIQVVGAQQAAIANDASGAVNQATVNAILAALRAHGLIGT